MSTITYLKLTGQKQGLISANCSSIDSIGNKYQKGHENEIFITEVSMDTMRSQNVIFQPVNIKKLIDKSSPLLLQALISNEILTCEFFHYRTSMQGGLELYYKTKLTEANIIHLTTLHPNSTTHNDYQPQESVSFKYKSIIVEHIMAGTSTYGIWEDSIY
ncbi:MULTISPECIES: Hcp family type VI secretion system effector [Providencia]|uniref:Hcp family type VI secretion system effector n=1 Tax=Providencia TaxID=586 RepID=UPI001120117A|nr:Hcp family type VI secretion system effector [Providencia stuartii]